MQRNCVDVKFLHMWFLICVLRIRYYRQREAKTTKEDEAFLNQLNTSKTVEVRSYRVEVTCSKNVSYKMYLICLDICSISMSLRYFVTVFSIIIMILRHSPAFWKLSWKHCAVHDDFKRIVVENKKSHVLHYLNVTLRNILDTLLSVSSEDIDSSKLSIAHWRELIRNTIINSHDYFQRL